MKKLFAAVLVLYLCASSNLLAEIQLRYWQPTDCRESVMRVQGAPIMAGAWSRYGTMQFSAQAPSEGGGIVSWFFEVSNGVLTPGHGQYDFVAPFQSTIYYFGESGCWDNCKTFALGANDIGTFGVLKTEGDCSGVCGGPDSSCDGKSKGKVEYSYVFTASPFRLDDVGGSCRNQVGDPINVVNGNVSHVMRDLGVPTPGFALAWERYYNSLNTHTGALGAGWSHSYDWFIRLTNTVDYGVTNTFAMLRTGTGSQHGYLRSTNTWMALGDCNGFLSDLTNGYSLRTMENLTYRFTTNGILNNIVDDWGNQVDVIYEYAYPTQRLIGVIHSAGAVLTIDYSGPRMAQVSSPYSNLMVSYSYDTNALLTNCAAGPNSTKVEMYRYAVGTNAVSACMTQRVTAAGFEMTWLYETNSSGQLTPRGRSSFAMTNRYLEVSIETNAASSSNAFKKTIRIYDGATNHASVYNIATSLQSVVSSTAPGDVDGTTGDRTSLSLNSRLKLTSQSTTEGGSGERYEISMRMQYESGDLFPTNIAAYVGLISSNLPSNGWSYVWDTNNLVMTSARDPEGVTFNLLYTNRSLASVLHSTEGTNVSISRYYYTTNGWLAGFTNANGGGAAFSYDGNGYVSGIHPAVGPSYAVSNNPSGYALRMTRQDGQTVLLDRDIRGHVSKVTYPDSVIESFGYDVSGDITNHVDRGGRTNRWAYTMEGVVSRFERERASGATSQVVSVLLDYDQQLRLRRVTDELGRSVQSVGRDSRGRVVSVTNLQGQTMSISYNVGSFVRSVARFDGSTVSNEYNEQGHLSTTRIGSATNVFDWYKNGVLRSARNEAGLVSNTMSAAGWISSSVGVAPSGAVTYTRYPAGNISSVVSVAGTTLYALDKADRLQGISGPGIGCSYTFSSNGLLDTVTYSNGVTGRYQWDSLDRLAQVDWIKGGTQTLRSLAYSYDTLGQITGVVRETGRRFQYAYDSLDRLSLERTLTGTATVVSSAAYNYDLAGNRLGMDRSGVQVSYIVDSGNKLTGFSVTGGTASLSVDVAGRSSETIGTNDLYGQLWVSNAVVVRPQVSGTNFWAHGLPAIVGTQTVVAAIRDAAGNTTVVSNRYTLQLITNAAYRYNTAGCLTSTAYRGTGGVTQDWRMVWNDRYELMSVQTNGADVESYGYDALGRRAWIAKGGVTNWLVYDSLHVIADVSASGTLVRSYIYGAGIDNLVGMNTYGATTNVYYCLKDHAGTVLAWTDSNGELAESYEYDAWGRVRAFDRNGKPLAESALGNRYTFQGREYSWASGMYYFRARWYEPATGRFLSRDPIGLAGGLNEHSFCGNSPLNFVDPFGLSQETLEFDYDYEWRRNLLKPGYIFDEHWTRDNNRFDPANDVTRRLAPLPWAGGVVEGNRWGNRQAGRQTTQSFGAPIGLLGCELMEFHFSDEVRLVDMAASFEDNLIGVGQAFVEAPVHTTAMGIGTMLMPHIAIPLNYMSDRLGDWAGGQ